MGKVYIFSNPAYDNLVKIGLTTDSLKTRRGELYTTGVPYPFDCEFAIEVEDEHAVERLVHEVFKDKRIKAFEDKRVQTFEDKRVKREFFKIGVEQVEQVIAALLLTGGKIVSLKDETGEEKRVVAQARKDARPRPGSPWRMPWKFAHSISTKRRPRLALCRGRAPGGRGARALRPSRG